MCYESTDDDYHRRVVNRISWKKSNIIGNRRSRWSSKSLLDHLRKTEMHESLTPRRLGESLFRGPLYLEVLSVEPTSRHTSTPGISRWLTYFWKNLLVPYRNYFHRNTSTKIFAKSLHESMNTYRGPLFTTNFL